MPVTPTAKRALRSSRRKASVNAKIRSALEASIRVAERTGSKKDISTASSLADRAAKKNIIHGNKAARIKSRLAQTKKPAKK